jgi:hypothetical protein
MQMPGSGLEPLGIQFFAGRDSRVPRTASSPGRPALQGPASGEVQSPIPDQEGTESMDCKVYGRTFPDEEGAERKDFRGIK